MLLRNRSPFPLARRNTMNQRSRIKGRVSPEASAARVSTWEVTDRPAGIDDVKRTSPPVTMDVVVGGLRPFKCASSTPGDRGRGARTLQRRSFLRQPSLINASSKPGGKSIKPGWSACNQHFPAGHRPVAPGKTGIGAKGCFSLGNDLVCRRGVIRFRCKDDQAGLSIMRGGLVWIEQKSLVSPLHRPRIHMHTPTPWSDQPRA